MSLRESKFSNCLYYTSNALSKKLSKMADEVFQPLGMAPSHAYLLMIVNDEPGIQPSEISRQLELTPSTVTRLIDKMEHKGFLERTSEGRATKVEPTEKTEKLHSKLEEAYQKLQDRYTEELGERYSEVLTEMAFKASEKL